VTRSSIYEFAGGEAAFLALARAHHERCLADPMLNHPFAREGLHPEHVERLAAYLGEVFGGPQRFSGECSDQSAMMKLHACNEIPAEMGQRFVACFVAAMDDAGLPQDAELRDRLRSYMEWAVAEMLAVSPRDSVVADGLPVPRWSWDAA
jgi:hemoglobin